MKGIIRIGKCEPRRARESSPFRRVSVISFPVPRVVSRSFVRLKRSSSRFAENGESPRDSRERELFGNAFVSGLVDVVSSTKIPSLPTPDHIHPRFPLAL